MTVDDFIRYGLALLTFLGAFAAVVVRLVRMEGKVKALTGVPQKVEELVTKVGLIWEIYISDALKRQQQVGNVMRQSRPRLTPAFYARFNAVIKSEMAEALRLIGKEALPEHDGDLAVVVIERIGASVVQERAEAFNLPVSEWLAIAVAWVRESEAHQRNKALQ